MWSVSPRFSWTTSTAPFGFCAAAKAPDIVPVPPGNVIASVRAVAAATS